MLSVGLLGGPIAGAIAGFSIGLVADMALVQTLGVTSLLLTGVGYLAGRYRELRDATHKLVPRARRLRRRRSASRPASPSSSSCSASTRRSARWSCATPWSARSLNALFAMPVFARRALGAAPGPGRGAAPAPARPVDEPAAEAWRPLMYLPGGDRRMVVTPQLALRVAILGGDRARAVRDRVLAPLVPAGAVGRQVPRRGEQQPRARGEGRGAARADRRSQRHGAGRQPHGARRPGAARAAAERSAPRARGRSARARPRARHAPRDGPQADPARTRASCRSARSRSRPTSRCTTVLYLQEHQTEFPGRRRGAGLPAQVPLRVRSARTCSARSAR